MKKTKKVQILLCMLITLLAVYGYITSVLFKIGYYKVALIIGTMSVRNYHVAVFYSAAMVLILIMSVFAKKYKKCIVLSVLIANVFMAAVSLMGVRCYKPKEVGCDDIANIMNIENKEGYGYSFFENTTDVMFIRAEDMPDDFNEKNAIITIITVPDDCIEKTEIVTKERFNLIKRDDRYVFNISGYADKLTEIYEESVSKVDIFAIVNDKVLTSGARMYRDSGLNNYFARGDMMEMWKLSTNQLGIIVILILTAWILYLCFGPEIKKIIVNNAKRGEYSDEKGKMIRGEWHDANFDEELLAERSEAEELCHQFNMARPFGGIQSSALRKLLDTDLPEGLTILAPVYFDYGYRTKFGSGCFVNHGCYFMDGGTISVGDNVFIGPFCGFYTASHPLDYETRNKGLERALPIIIGDNCWFGANVTVLQGVTIGSGCVIAAGSVVTEDIPDNAMAAGVPAVVKKIIEQ